MHGKGRNPAVGPETRAILILGGSEGWESKLRKERWWENIQIRMKGHRKQTLLLYNCAYSCPWRFLSGWLICIHTHTHFYSESIYSICVLFTLISFCLCQLASFFPSHYISSPSLQEATQLGDGE